MMLFFFFGGGGHFKESYVLDRYVIVAPVWCNINIIYKVIHILSHVCNITCESMNFITLPFSP